MPPFKLAWGHVETLGSVVMMTGYARIEWGDVLLTADRATFDTKTRTGEASGHVVVIRGDETIRGDFFVFDGEKGLFDTRNAVALSPPFSVRGARAISDSKGIRAENAIISLRPDGGGEIQFTADRAELRNDTRRLILKNARINLYGNRLLTLRSLSIPLSTSKGGVLGSGTSAPPVIFRASRISGTVFGIGTNFSPFAQINGRAVAETTSREGFQYDISLQKTLLGPTIAPPSRRDPPLPGERDPKLKGQSPLRQVLTARSLPTAYDPVLDFYDITTIFNELLDPTYTETRNVTVGGTFTSHREFGTRRQGPLLLSRRPEVSGNWNVPLSGPLPVRDNAAARIGLRHPRYLLTGDAATGRYEELRLDEERNTVNRNRTRGMIGVGLLPLLVGERLLVSGRVSYQYNGYGGGQNYRVLEDSVYAEWVLGRRRGMGAALIQRTPQGKTPFFFDAVDTQKEAQVRAMTLLPGGKYTVSGVARYDLAQHSLFDWEIAVSARGSVLEPRFSYRRLNSQFGFSVGFPILTGL